MSTVHTVLLPLDGSPRAEAALPHATGMALRLGTRLLLVRAVQARPLPGQDPRARRAEEVGRARAYLTEVALRIHAQYPQLAVGTAVPIGSATESILDEAVLEHADLIVMATRGASGAVERGVGRVSGAVLHRTVVPVLLVHAPADDAAMADAAAVAAPVETQPGAAPWLRQRLRVLVPLDASAPSEAALAYVVRLGAYVTLDATLLHVLRPPASAEDAPRAGEPVKGTAGAAAVHAALDVAGLDEDEDCRACDECRPELVIPCPDAAAVPCIAPAFARLEPRQLSWAMAAAYCHRAASWMGAHGVTSRAEVRTGQPADEIIRASGEGADLIVFATCARMRLTRWGVSHVIDRVVQRAGAPVLVVPSYRTDPVLPVDAERKMSALRAENLSPADGIRVFH